MTEQLRKPEYSDVAAACKGLEGDDLKECNTTVKLRDQVIDEAKAIADYTDLMKMTDDTRFKNLIHKIREHERSHFQALQNEYLSRVPGDEAIKNLDLKEGLREE